MNRFSRHTSGTRGLPLNGSENISGQQKLTAEYVRRRAVGQPGTTYRIEFTSSLCDAVAWSAAGRSR